MSTQHSGGRRAWNVREGGEPHWVGDGFLVRTMFSYDEDQEPISPFLLLDYGRPARFEPTTERRGVGQHPHRGFETVTIAFQGEVEHHDSAGNRGRIGPGDVQWMTAGAGILHEEYLGEEFSRKGGVLEMAQVWVNLPAALKKTKPRYQDIAADRIPEVRLPGGGGEVRVIAGDCFGVKGPAKTFTPIEMWRVRLDAGSRVELPIPVDHNAMILVLRGEISVRDEVGVGEGRLAMLDRDGATRVSAKVESSLLVLAGKPLDEPVVGYGPFVMNTQQEIQQAVRDLQTGRFVQP